MNFIKRFVHGKIWVLLEKMMKSEGIKKWAVYAVVVVAIITIVSVSFGLIWYAVDDYLYEYKETPRLYEFYEEDIGENNSVVYFIGSSQIGDSCYAPLINQCLQDNQSNVTAYTLYVSGDNPIRRSTQTQNIIDSHPKMLIYGVTYGDFVQGGWWSERVIVVHDKLKIRNDSLYLYSASELNDIGTEPTVFWKKTFLKNALFRPTNEYIGDYHYDMHARTMHDILSAVPQPPDINTVIAEANSPSNYWNPEMTSENTRYCEALRYMVQRFDEAGIDIVIINMPLHPVISEKISAESRQNMYKYLDSLGCSWYDLERDYGEDYFKDSHHFSNYGAKYFSPRMAELIIQELG